MAAGLEATGGAGVVLVLAVDLPLLTAADLGLLLTTLAGDPELGAATAVDHHGRPHPLLAAYRLDALRVTVAAAGAGHGAAAAGLLPERTATVDLGPVATLNVNTVADLARARHVLASQHDELSG